MTQQELLRYSRQIKLSEIGIVGQEKLKAAKVLVIGAGGLGCPVLQYLSASGVGNLGVVDFDKVEESNLNRQILYSVKDIEKKKVVCAVQNLSAYNPNTRFDIYDFKLINENALDIINKYDIIVDGTDNFSARYMINDACMILDKPLIYGAIYKFEGQVSVLNYSTSKNEKGPSYRCLFPDPFLSGYAPNCSETGVLGILPGIVGTLQANEAVKLITGIGKILSGELLLINSLSMNFSKVVIERNPAAIASAPGTAEQFVKTDYSNTCLHKQKICGEIGARDLYYILSKERHTVQLLDVRDYCEQPEIAALKELQIPVYEIVEKEYLIDKTKKIIAYCGSGSRSRIAVQILQKHFGISNLYSLKGGINEWIRTMQQIPR